MSSLIIGPLFIGLESARGPLLAVCAKAAADSLPVRRLVRPSVRPSVCLSGCLAGRHELPRDTSSLGATLTRSLGDTCQVMVNV